MKTIKENKKIAYIGIAIILINIFLLTTLDTKQNTIKNYDNFTNNQMISVKKKSEMIHKNMENCLEVGGKIYKENICLWNRKDVEFGKGDKADITSLYTRLDDRNYLIKIVFRINNKVIVKEDHVSIEK